MQTKQDAKLLTWYVIWHKQLPMMNCLVGRQTINKICRVANCPISHAQIIRVVFDYKHNIET